MARRPAQTKRSADQITDHQGLRKIVSGEQSQRGDQLRKRDVEKGRVAEDESEFLAKPFGPCEVKMPEAWQVREPLVDVEDRHVDFPLNQTLPDLRAADAAGRIPLGNKVREAVDCGLIKEVLFPLVSLFHVASR